MSGRLRVVVRPSDFFGCGYYRVLLPGVTLHAARDVELQRAEELGRQGPRSRPLGRSLPEQRRRFHAAGGRASSTSGAGTSASTRSRIASAVTPSASA